MLRRQYLRRAEPEHSKHRVVARQLIENVAGKARSAKNIPLRDRISFSLPAEFMTVLFFVTPKSRLIKTPVPARVQRNSSPRAFLLYFQLRIFVVIALSSLPSRWLLRAVTATAREIAKWKAGRVFIISSRLGTS